MEEDWGGQASHSAGELSMNEQIKLYKGMCTAQKLSFYIECESVKLVNLTFKFSQ